jgi:hypothetical protein
MPKAKKARKKRTHELENQQKRWPVDEFDFMVAGVNFDRRHHIIERCLSTNDRVKIVPEPDNSHDEYAVAITLAHGRKIGYVPRTESEDVSACIDDGNYYVATVKKILSDGQFPVPVVTLRFYRPDQLADLADLKPDQYTEYSPILSSARLLRVVAYGFARALLIAVRFFALQIGTGVYFTVASLTKWVASVKDDLQGEKEREVNPAALLEKLLAVAVIFGVLIIPLIKLTLRFF